jgi:hypothetical protein
MTKHKTLQSEQTVGNMRRRAKFAGGNGGRGGGDARWHRAVLVVGAPRRAQWPAAAATPDGSSHWPLG